MNATNDLRPDDSPAQRSRWERLAELWFGLRAPVDRVTYLASGIALVLIKYICDATLVYAWAGHVLSPMVYLVPSIIVRHDTGGPDFAMGCNLALALLTLPFLWIGLTMSVRRAAHAGYTPWTGFLFLLPVLNHLVMIVLAALPSRTPVTAILRPSAAPPPAVDKKVQQTLLAVLVPMALGLVMCWVSVYAIGSYGGVLFLATPCFMGALSAYLSNRAGTISLGRTLALALLSLVAGGFGLLLFAVEGLFCLMMALPIGAALTASGAIVGWMVTAKAPSFSAPVSLWVLVLPGTAALENAMAVPSVRQVTTTVEVDAPPERVWPRVIGFAAIPPPSDLVFRMGIAYPMRARLDGEGVGAVRRCEFSTGPFVEPITAWDPPRRLGFDVIAQPQSMTEWSPYHDLRAPHLEGYMVSKRGEFRLVALPGDRTRLEGTTWYTLSIYPEGYWVVYADALLHAIHRRVLVHIKSETEQPR